jgi:hypothetical protein
MSAWESSYAGQGESASAGTLGVGHQRSRPRVPVDESWRLRPGGFGLAWPNGSRPGEAGLLLEVPACWRKPGLEAGQPSQEARRRPSRKATVPTQPGKGGRRPRGETAQLG